MSLCVTCQSQLTGPYCHVCGEKQVTNEDFTLKHIIGQAVDNFANLDSKLFKSFYYLIFKAGRLSSAYVIGNRNPFMKPFQIFLLTNILFFILLSHADVFRKPSSWWFKQTLDTGYPVKKRTEEIIAQKNISMQELAVQYDDQSNNLAKGLVGILIPLFALILSLINITRKLVFGKHLIFAIHYFSFHLLIIIFWTLLISILQISFNKYVWFYPIQFILLFYLAMAIRHFYGDRLIWAVGKSLIFLVLIYMVMELYRAGISILSLNWI